MEFVLGSVRLNEPENVGLCVIMLLRAREQGLLS